jgi:hypothetical protein
MGDRISMIQEG